MEVSLKKNFKAIDWSDWSWLKSYTGFMPGGELITLKSKKQETVASWFGLVTLSDVAN